MTTPPPSPSPGDGPAATWVRATWRRFRGLPTAAQAVLSVLVLSVGLGVLVPAEDGGRDADRRDSAAVAADVTGATDEAGAAARAAAAAERTERAAQRRAERVAERAAERRAEALAERQAEARARREAAEVAREAEAAARAEAEAAAAATATAAWTVTNVVDGDTVDVRHADGTEERVRVVGIDTPERGECGFAEASAALAALVLDEQVELVAGARDDRDRWDRILRYVDVDGVDAGLSLIEAGLAIARYDSRDGYGRHPREAAYVAADAATPTTCTRAAEPAPTPAAPSPPATPSPGGPGTGPGGAYRNCTEARELGGAPVHEGQPGYGTHLDRDRDGIGCE